MTIWEDVRDIDTVPLDGKRRAPPWLG
jgi:hypothetical protein